VPPEAEFEITPGRKVKASEVTAWEKNHQAFEGMKPLRDLDTFLARPENKELGDALVGMLNAHKGNPAMVKQILGLLSGAPATNGAPATPAANPLAAMEASLDLTDPSVKALYDGFKALQSKLGELDQFRTTSQTEASKATEAQQVSDAKTRLQGEMDTSWKSNGFDALLERVDPKAREQTGNLLRSMILTVAGLPGPNQVPIAQVAKTLHGQMSGLIEGVINAYVSGKKAPPAGGGRGPVSTPPVTAELGSDQLQAEIVEGLRTASAARE
jgi:hypothetical protein